MSGLERLRRAADRRLGRNSKKFADLWEKNALDGKLDHARLLVALAEKKKPEPEPEPVEEPRGKSWAMQLADEMREQGAPAPEEEVALGTGEPKN